MSPVKAPQPGRVILVSAYDGESAVEDARVAEMAELVKAAGGIVVETVMQRRVSNSGPLLLGKGKVEELAEICERTGVSAVVTRQDLTPPQQKHLEDALPCGVLDRTALILDIFSRHASSSEGKLQVELARMLYRLPRLRGKGTEMSRLGGGGKSSGGVRTRGPGEQELEYSKRRIRDRISKLKKDLEAVRERRGRQRSQRRDRAIPVAVLVGYTNAGKSSMFTAMTRTATLVKSQMFSTLDPKAGMVRLPGGGRVLLNDTVGFISELPDDLRVAFRATLEEIAEADVLVHVVDSSRSDANSQVRAVVGELNRMGADKLPRITVFNKADIAGQDEARMRALESGEPTAIAVSARKGTGIPEVLRLIEEALREDFWTQVLLRDGDGRMKAEFTRMGVSFSEDVRGSSTEPILKAWVSPAQASQFAGQGIGGKKT
jgi:GTP-binding protein HflX